MCIHTDMTIHKCTSDHPAYHARQFDALTLRSSSLLSPKRVHVSSNTAWQRASRLSVSSPTPHADHTLIHEVDVVIEMKAVVIGGNKSDGGDGYDYDGRNCDGWNYDIVVFDVAVKAKMKRV